MELQSLLSILNATAAIAVVLGLCLFFHEAGHFMAAKAFKCRVHDFAFGFGPSLLKTKRGETTYRFNLVPFGGYVRIAGMEPGAEAEEGGFYSIPRYQSAIILCAGVGMNVVLAIIVFTGVSMWSGVPDPDDGRILVGRVMAGSAAERDGLLPNDEVVAIDGCRRSLFIREVRPGGPAEEAGLRPGMLISTVDDAPVHLPITLYQRLASGTGPAADVAVLDFSVGSITDQQRIVRLPRDELEAEDDCAVALQWLQDTWGVAFANLNSAAIVGGISLKPGKPVDVTVIRQGVETVVRVTPDTQWARYPMRDRSGIIKAPHAQVGRIGIVLQGARLPVSFGDALRIGVVGSYEAVKLVVDSLGMILTKKVEGGAGGPVAIMAMSAEQARIGWDAVFRWVGLISANLAVINMIPFPPFDGFRVVLIGWEGIIRRRINAEKELAFTLAGFITIIILVLILTGRDVLNLVRYGTP